MKPYKGYKAEITKPEDAAEPFNGVVAGLLRDVIHFAGDTLAELEQAFHDSVDDYLEWCAEDGVSPQVPKQNMEMNK